MTALAVAALALFVASPASAHDEDVRRGHHATGCRDPHHHHGLRHHPTRHQPGHGGPWRAGLLGLGVGLYLPHFELRIEQPYRSYRIERRDVRRPDRRHRNRRDRRDRRDRRG